MNEQDETGQSRRERRRAEASRDSNADVADDETRAASDAGPGGEEPSEEPSASESVIEENRKARRAAAARRRNKREKEREKAQVIGLDAGEMVDDALARTTDATMKWLRKHFNIVQWVIVLGVGGWIGWEIYSWRVEKNVAKASDLLFQGITAERGQDGATPSLDKAAESYRNAAAARSGSSTASLAKLGLAGVLYDQKKFADAIGLYEEVAASKLAKDDPDVKGRALEGVVLGLEGKGDIDGALKKAGELANADLPGFSDLARYHQARLHYRKGDRDRAKELLVKLVEKLGKAEKPGAPPGYLFTAARDLLGTIDPKALPQPTADEALQKALQEFQKNLPQGVSMPMQVPAPAPAPAPPAPAK